MKWYSLGVSSLLCIGLLTACGSTSSEQTELWSEQACTGHMTLQYATEFSVDYYDPYALITIADNQQYLLVPERNCSSGTGHEHYSVTATISKSLCCSQFCNGFI